jgi:carbon monoxide dehydrogenase subunit G
MAEVNVSRQIAAPQEKVWAVLASPGRFGEWLTLHTSWKEEPPAELSLGANLTEVVTIMGMPNTITWTVDSYVPPSSLRISGTGMAGAKVAFTLSVQAEGGSCVATIDAEFVSQIMAGAIGAAVERNAVKELDVSLDKLTALVA